MSSAPVAVIADGADAVVPSGQVPMSTLAGKLTVGGANMQAMVGGNFCERGAADERQPSTAGGGGGGASEQRWNSA